MKAESPVAEAKVDDGNVERRNVPLLGQGLYPDCTGTAVINVPGNPLSPVRLHFVVVKQGKEIRTVADANAVTSIGIKVE